MAKSQRTIKDMPPVQIETYAGKLERRAQTIRKEAIERAQTIILKAEELREYAHLIRKFPKYERLIRKEGPSNVDGTRKYLEDVMRRANTTISLVASIADMKKPKKPFPYNGSGTAPPRIYKAGSPLTPVQKSMNRGTGGTNR